MVADHLKTSFSMGLALSFLSWGALQFGQVRHAASVPWLQACKQPTQLGHTVAISKLLWASGLSAQAACQHLKSNAPCRGTKQQGSCSMRTALCNGVLSTCCGVTSAGRSLWGRCRPMLILRDSSSSFATSRGLQLRAMRARSVHGLIRLSRGKWQGALWATAEAFLQVGNMDADHEYWGRPEDMEAAGVPRPAYVIDKAHPGSDMAGMVAAGLASASMVRVCCLGSFVTACCAAGGHRCRMLAWQSRPC